VSLISKGTISMQAMPRNHFGGGETVVNIPGDEFRLAISDFQPFLNFPPNVNHQHQASQDTELVLHHAARYSWGKSND
jgi:hypothetical protein